MVATASVSPQQYRFLDLEDVRPIPRLVPDLPPVESVAAEAVQQLRASLQTSVAARLTSGSELVRALDRRRREESLPTAVEAIDALLGGGVARGKVTEIAGRGLRFSVVLSLLAAATAAGEAATLIDVGDHFDPQIGELAGIDLRRLLWVRPKTMKQAGAAAEMLSATGFQLVILDAGLPPLRGRIPDAGWVRLARTAEAHGTALLVSAPYALTGTTSEAMLAMGRATARWAPAHETSIGGGAEPRLLAGFDAHVRLEKHRHKRAGESVMVSFRSAECPVPSAGHPTPSSRAQRGIPEGVREIPRYARDDERKRSDDEGKRSDDEGKRSNDGAALGPRHSALGTSPTP
jgi:hypothetical protein